LIGNSDYPYGKIFILSVGIILCSVGAVLRDTKPRRKRNKLVTLLLLPALAMIWVVGWSLYWIGSRQAKNPKKSPIRTRSEGGVMLVPSVAFEQEIVEASL
jgi:hypothetical protein